MSAQAIDDQYTTTQMLLLSFAATQSDKERSHAG